MNKRKKPLFIVLLPLLMGLVFGYNSAHAIQASSKAFTEHQPDGTQLKLHIRGDEHFNWLEDVHGYTVVRNKGWLEYARLKNDKLVASGLIVGRASPQANGLQKRTLPSKVAQRASAKNIDSTQSVTGPEQTAPSGTIKNLVVLIRFANHGGRDVPSIGDVDILMNAVDVHATLAPTGSVRGVYLENSYNQIDLQSEVQPWVQVSGTEQYYANSNSGDSTLWEALREALDSLDTDIDFRDYDTDNDGKIDAITFLHSGYGAEWGGNDSYGTPSADRIWSHRWAIQQPPWVSEEGVEVFDYHISPALWGTSGSAIGRIGVIAHETGHFFGLPDLYDSNAGGAGIGSYGLMANSWDFDGTQYCPPHFSPWSKANLGWYLPQSISSTGIYTLDKTEQPGGTNEVVYKIDDGFPSGEYLLIENRQNAGFDCTLPQGGLAIWHIDESVGDTNEGYPDQPGRGRSWPENGKHYRVALLQADGEYDLERDANRGDSGDVFHGGAVNSIGPGPDTYPNTDSYKGGRITQTGHTITDISASADVMTFCLNCEGTPPPPPGDAFDPPSNLTATVTRSGKGKNATKSVTLNWTDNSTGSQNEDSFQVERCEEIGPKKNKTCAFSDYHSPVSQDVTSFSDPETLSGTYKYRVRAVKGTQETASSNEVKI